MQSIQTSPIGDKMSAALKENISEIKRGRPAVMDAETEALFICSGLFSKDSPRRSKMNVYYRQRAVSVLGGCDYKWLVDERMIMLEGDKHWKPTILTELGRIEDEDDMRAVAERLCEMKPTTRDAVLMVRSLRTGGLPAGDTLQLANEIIQTINRYLHSHVGVTREGIFDALRTAAASIDESGIK